MFRGDGERRSFSLHKDSTVIGRREDCDLRIPLGEISRKHCRISLDGEALRLEDLGSSNGTYVNGNRIQEATVHAGDTIQLGHIAFVVQVDGVPADEDLAPQLVTAQPNQETTTPQRPATPAPVDGENGEFDPMAILGSDDSGMDSGIEINFESGETPAERE